MSSQSEYNQTDEDEYIDLAERHFKLVDIFQNLLNASIVEINQAQEQAEKIPKCKNFKFEFINLY